MIIKQRVTWTTTLAALAVLLGGAAAAQNMSGNGAPMSGMSGKEYRAAIKACNAGPAEQKAQCRRDAKSQYKQSGMPAKTSPVPKAPAQ